MPDTPSPEPRAHIRDETEAERYDRNWNELLQELRVAQTGTQILAGFLLTLPFAPRFSDLNDAQSALYLALILIATLATVLGLSPVSIHRLLFRQRVKGALVDMTSRIVLAMLVTVGLLFIGTVFFIFDVVAGTTPAVIAAAAVLVVIVVVWTIIPRAMKSALRRHEEPNHTVS